MDADGNILIANRVTLDMAREMRDLEWCQLFEYRLDDMYFKPIDTLLKGVKRNPFQSMSVLMLISSLIDFLEKIFKGEGNTLNRRGNNGDLYPQFMVSYLNYDENLARTFYYHVRCGLFHQGHIGLEDRTRRNRDDRMRVVCCYNHQHALEMGENGAILVNPRHLYSDIKLFIESFISEYDGRRAVGMWLKRYFNEELILWDAA